MVKNLAADRSGENQARDLQVLSPRAGKRSAQTDGVLVAHRQDRAFRLARLLLRLLPQPGGEIGHFRPARARARPAELDGQLRIHIAGALSDIDEITRAAL